MLKRKVIIVKFFLLFCLNAYCNPLESRELSHGPKSKFQADCSIEANPFFKEFYTCLQTGALLPAERTYFLLDQNRDPKYVIKPNDERIVQVKAHIPLFRTAQAEALSSAFASILGMNRLTPETHLAKISLSEEKLCSVQVYVSDVQTLFQIANEWLKQNVSDEQLLTLIDQTDLEDLFLLIWLLYDTDAHARNIYAKKDASGIYHLIKFDNGLTFPDKNGGLFNALALLPQAKNQLSARIINQIQNLPVEKLTKQILFFEMEDALKAFLERVKTLQELVKTPYSFREINSHLCRLEQQQLHL